MKQRKQLFAALMAGLLCFSLVACGSANSYKGSGAAMEATTDSTGSLMVTNKAPGAGMYDSAYDKEYDAPVLESSGGSSVYQQSDVKLIRRASLTIQTTEFDQALVQLDALVGQFSGYYENAEIYSGSYNNKNANRSGNYTIRIPAEQYDAFLSQVGDVGHLTRKTESTENVGEAYYDLEARLKTQRTKQERLLALLEKADNMKDIIELESALSDVEYQIEQYSSSLKRYDGLIGYATITLNLNEVIKIVDEPTEKDSLWVRMGAGVVSSFDALVDTVEGFLLWVSYNVFALVIFGLFFVVAMVLLRKNVKQSRVLRRRANKNEPESLNDQDEQDNA